MNYHALWIVEKGRAEIRPIDLPSCSPEQVRVHTLFSALSRGTEQLVFDGAVPPEEHERMQAPFQDGSFSFPIKYGYCNVGRVETGPAELINKTVFCLFPHQTHYVVDRNAVTLLPAGVPPERAVLAANLETAINALWDAQISLGDRVSIVGAGVVGCLVAWLASRIPGCDVELIDNNEQRQAVAQALGVEFARPDDAQANRDLLIHTSASAEGLGTALRLAGKEATVLELSWYGNRPVSVNLGGSFHSQRLQLKSSQVGQLALCHRSRWTYQRRLQLALSLLTDDTVDCLISGESRFADLPCDLPEVLKGNPAVLCHRVRYEDSTGRPG